MIEPNILSGDTMLLEGIILPNLEERVVVVAGPLDLCRALLPNHLVNFFFTVGTKQLMTNGK